MKKSFISIIVVCMACLICLVGCDVLADQDDNSMKKYTVELTLDNYLDYLTIATTTNSGDMVSSYEHNFSGALDYAYYDNVVITYNLISNSSSSTKTETKTLKLDVGGCGSITTSSSRFGSTSYEITDVSGTLTYWF